MHVHDPVVRELHHPARARHELAIVLEDRVPAADRRPEHAPLAVLGPGRRPGRVVALGDRVAVARHQPLDRPFVVPL
jgi:hypothetical protein